MCEVWSFGDPEAAIDEAVAVEVGSCGSSPSQRRQTDSRLGVKPIPPPTYCEPSLHSFRGKEKHWGASRINRWRLEIKSAKENMSS